MRHAIGGIRVVFVSEQSFRIQLLASIAVLLLGAFVQVQAYQWIVLILLIGSVLVLELINSIFERIVDAFKPRIHPIVKDIKDIMAGAVLIASIVAAIVGIVIFYPYLQELVSSVG
ncbi:diacylglycerol kinase family protein [Candidatus Uhrbacteria bacterium]|nr:diacylglycerol kinase family protein [Candidatus Uhrbacteria bacterium]